MAIACEAKDALDYGILCDVPLYSCQEREEEVAEKPILQEPDVWPRLTPHEAQKLKALPYLRRWVSESNLPVPGAPTPAREQIPHM